MSVSIVGNRKIRTLSVMDDYSREAFAIELDTELSVKSVLGALVQINEEGNKPLSITMDFRYDSTSKNLNLWSLDKGINL